MGKKSEKESHTGFRNEHLFCFHCGVSQQMPTPMPIQLATDFMKSFAKLHKGCKKVWAEPVNVAADQKDERTNCLWWLQNGEHGISSKTMFNYLTCLERAPLSIYEEDHPRDPDDFSRCYKLLKAVPSFKSKLYRLKRNSPAWDKLIDNWDKLIDNWDKLTELFEKKEYKEMNHLMQGLDH